MNSKIGSGLSNSYVWTRFNWFELNFYWKSYWKLSTTTIQMGCTPTQGQNGTVGRGPTAGLTGRPWRGPCHSGGTRCAVGAWSALRAQPERTPWCGGWWLNDRQNLMEFGATPAMMHGLHSATWGAWRDGWERGAHQRGSRHRRRKRRAHSRNDPWMGCLAARGPHIH
jgi:hypothetical protein